MDPPARPKAGPLETGKDGAGARREVFALARRCANVLRMARYRQGGQGGHEDGFSRAAVTAPSLRPAADARAGQVGQAPPAAVASEQQRAGQAPSASSSDGARPAGDLRHEERRPARRRRRGGGDISTRSKRCASHTPIYSLSPPPFLPLPTHRPLQLLQPALRSATQRKGEGRSAATATSTSRSRGHAPSPSPSLVKRFFRPATSQHVHRTRPTAQGRRPRGTRRERARRRP